MSAIILKQIDISLARANWWINFANTTKCKSRIIHKGFSDAPLMTEDELVEDAFKTANQHIRNAEELLDSLKG
jgi:Mg2+ and Co2+ transporter CorA